MRHLAMHKVWTADDRCGSKTDPVLRIRMSPFARCGHYCARRRGVRGGLDYVRSLSDMNQRNRFLPPRPGNKL
jgi:hypothetical protein